MLVGKWPGGHVSKQLCRPPAPQASCRASYYCADYNVSRTYIQASELGLDLMLKILLTFQKSRDIIRSYIIGLLMILSLYL